MTNKEAKEILDTIPLLDYDGEVKPDWIIAIDIAIKALEQKPCEDAISRQAVLDAIEDDNRNGHYSCFASNNDAQCFKGVIGELPSVKPQVICPSHGVDCKDCPVINGEWVAKPDGRFIYAQCSNCGEIHDVASNYCPSCGCIMDKNDFNAYIKAESEE